MTDGEYAVQGWVPAGTTIPRQVVLPTRMTPLCHPRRRPPEVDYYLIAQLVYGTPSW